MALSISSLRRNVQQKSFLQFQILMANVNGFSNWPLATCIWKLGGSSILRLLLGAFCSIVSKSSWAIPLTNAPESSRASTVKFFSKSRGTKSISCFRFKTTVDVNGRYISFVCSSRTSPSSISRVAAVRGRSATEENDSGGYVDVPWSSKVKQRSSTADWLEF